METQETNQLHVEGTTETQETQEVETLSQFGEDTEVTQPGADTKSKETPKTPPKTEVKADVKNEAKPEPKKTYSQEEVAEIQRKKDGELAEYQKKLAQISLKQQIEEAQRQESQIQLQDKQEVESGAISQKEADSRKELRGQAAKLSQMIQQLTPQAEQLGRIACANEMAKEYGIKAEDLIGDMALTSPQQMERKAAKLALAAKDLELRKFSAKPETFDKGPAGGSEGESSESLSIEEIENMPIEKYAQHKSIKKRYE